MFAQLGLFQSAERGMCVNDIREIPSILLANRSVRVYVFILVCLCGRLQLIDDYCSVTRFSWSDNRSVVTLNEVLLLSPGMNGANTFRNRKMFARP